MFASSCTRKAPTRGRCRNPTKPTKGGLFLTPFSRHCAQLWVRLFGRRFTCQQRRKNSGGRNPWRLQGSFKMVKVRHRVCTRQIGAHGGCGQRPCIRSEASPHHLRISSQQQAPSSADNAHSFRVVSERRFQEQMQRRFWNGLGRAPPEMQHLPKASSASATSRGKTHASAASRGVPPHAAAAKLANSPGSAKVVTGVTTSAVAQKTYVAQTTVTLIESCRWLARKPLVSASA